MASNHAKVFFTLSIFYAERQVGKLKGIGKKFPGGSTVKMRSKNPTIKPPSTLSVSSMKIQRSQVPFLPLAANAHAVNTNF